MSHQWLIDAKLRVGWVAGQDGHKLFHAQWHVLLVLCLYSKVNIVSSDAQDNSYIASFLADRNIGLKTEAEDEFLQDGNVVELTMVALIISQF